ncbi:hypothetical protein KAW50_08930 [candidate division WOR-3 bacterium]|nr:hypothetical protein [candidate division WOR-3 bacterium]
MKELFEKHGVIKTGHFKLTSGKHSAQYINKDAIYSNPMLFDIVVQRMRGKINVYKDMIDVVTGPAIAGAILAAPVSLLLNKIFVYPEKADDKPLAGNPGKGTKMVFRRGYDKILKGKRVWIVEDIITTGGSVEKTIRAVEECGGKITGVSVIWNRCRNPLRELWRMDSVLLLSLINEFVPSYWPEECPNCRAGELLQDPKG